MSQVYPIPATNKTINTTPVSNEEFSLDTTNFNYVAELSEKLSEKMETLKDDLDGIKNDLMFSWAGEGRNMFEKKYRLLSQQFGDLSDDLREISENILTIEEKYIQRDTDLAKLLDGVDSRY